MKESLELLGELLVVVLIVLFLPIILLGIGIISILLLLVGIFTGPDEPTY